MGKIRIKTIGLEEVEKKQKKDAVKRREAKKFKKETLRDKSLRQAQDKSLRQARSEQGRTTQDRVKAPQVKGAAPTLPKASKGLGRMKQVEVAEEEVKKQQAAAKLVEKKRFSPQGRRERTHGKKYKEVQSKVKKGTEYSIKDALGLIKKISYVKFDATIDAHLNVREIGIKGEVSFPHGTGKKTKVAVVNDDVFKQIEAGDIDFDVLIARPSDMPKLAKHAKVLGPRGLMPSPKTGTISDDTASIVKKFSSGAVRYKTEAKAPIIHQSVGKLSNSPEELAENIEAFLKSVGTRNIESAYL
ncbi:MAG: hypothetical protein ACE5DQ_01215, partial [Candidatus Paceibacterota bacterium]